MYDLIGDIHGHADELHQLLATLGYGKVQGVYRHPQRKVIFLGDFIDRGPQIRQVLETVRPMVEQEAALAVMGNHELNALAYHTADPEAPGEFLRRNTEKNQKQHGQTLLQLKPEELRSHLDWFRTLPLWLDLPGLRAVHACWNEAAKDRITQTLSEKLVLDASFLHSACRPKKPLFESVETMLKGPEMPLPAGMTFRDKDGHERNKVRTRWYAEPGEHTYRTYSMTDDLDCNLPLETEIIQRATPYPASAKPVFIGHYWLRSDAPRTLASNVACLDFSVAKGGFLCAYRWNGEQTLTKDNFVWVKK